MVHRPADSRLLTNLLSHEKEYYKQLSVLLDTSHASLASFSAYASASAPPVAQAVIAVAGALAGADEALRSYAASVEQWQGQLKLLKELEDDVGNVVRDREILVTRLIKVSKTQKPTRDSLLNIGDSHSSSSLTFTKPEVQVGSKLSAAQAELQACEAHLAAKERELDALRTYAIKNGLQSRCRAMVETGWRWGEMGKEGLRALETFEVTDNTAGSTSPQSYPYQSQKPLPGVGSPDQPSSDMSSIAPSQSASQVTHQGSSDLNHRHQGSLDMNHGRQSSSDMNHRQNATSERSYAFYVPPAHSVGEFGLPNGMSDGYTNGFAGAPRAIEPVEEEGGSSADEGDVGPVEVHENERFATGKRKSITKIIAAKPPVEDKRVHFPRANGREGANAKDSRKDHADDRDKPKGSSVFGSIVALFGHGYGKGKSSSVDGDSPTKSSPTKRWQTRTGRNLKAAKKSKGRDSDSDDADASHAQTAGPSSSAPVIPPGSMPSSVSAPAIATGSQRLRKRSTKRGSILQTPKDKPAEKGWVSDDVVSGSKRGKARKKPISIPDGGADDEAAPRGSTVRGKKYLTMRAGLTPAFAPQTTLSRNSSLSKQSVMSAASAPVRATTFTTIRPAPAPAPMLTAAEARNTASRHTATAARKPARSQSLSVPSTASPRAHRRVISTTTVPAARTLMNGEPSLLSIVEGVARQNRAAWAQQDPNRLLVVPKAPPPLNINLDQDLFSPTGLGIHIQPAANGHAGSDSPKASKPKQDAMTSASGSGDSLQRSPAASGGSPVGNVDPSSPTQTVSGNVVPSSSTQTMPGHGPHNPVIGKMPLRSALRNGSRTPSPNPPQTLRPQLLVSPKLVAARPAPLATRPSPEAQPQTNDDDAASISSYETGHEAFEDDAQPPPPPPHDPPRQSQDTPQSDLSHASTSTATTTQQHVRRKSVRMSLPPTFSATPPATDDDARDAAHQPWSDRGTAGMQSAWQSHVKDGTTADMWADSSDEDDEYKKAKRMLSKFQRRAGR